MSTSGMTSFNPNASEIAEEAFERCGLELRTGYDNETARRSMNYLVTHWANKGINLWTVSNRQLNLIADQASYSMQSDIIDILSGVIVRSNTDSNTERISREDFLNIPSKSSTGKPSQWYLERGADLPILNFFLTPENSTDIFKFDCLTRMQDLSKGTDTVQIPFRFYEAFVAGISFHLALKRAPDRVQVLKALYDESFNEAAGEDRDRATYKIIPDVSAYYRS
tara:strand:- start:380 stop:1051 length:672 start_codon:yes stop_codon:yes gene_type:complete